MLARVAAAAAMLVAAIYLVIRSAPINMLENESSAGYRSPADQDTACAERTARELRR